MTRAEIKSETHNLLSHPGAPVDFKQGEITHHNIEESEESPRKSIPCLNAQSTPHILEDGRNTQAVLSIKELTNTDEFEILALGHMEWIFQKEIIYCSLFLLNCFSLCQVDPLKQPSPYLTF
ncbi:uncharacterized protein LOC102155390 isoform X5 [Canis lupus familiaris]|uniref:uncharacterized protein LOC102155390 isoform X5 n=1 Tax=Canis lupus familiaris TaxID=9615 RepID=UPI0018F4C2A6|nr:uncharacterized protein LOC102155390 isoform X5 [Canis lupus familiaris]XP_038429275.1 uncharacterized protein LOC102155390 isoform X3 [Canis lupus familiaris]